MTNQYTSKDLTLKGVTYMFMFMVVFLAIASNVDIASISYRSMDSGFNSVMGFMMSGLDILSRLL